MTDQATMTADMAANDGPILSLAGDPVAFRAAVRDWIEDALKRRAAIDGGKEPDFEESQRWWMAERNKVGLGTPHWPRAYGGADLSLRNQVLVAEEMARAKAPPLSMFVVSLHHVPATLMHWGTEEQKKKYLPGVANGVVWCQGFSEPGAGSDLAALRCRAERDGDYYVINGQKIWSSFSMFASHSIFLARTDPTAPKHKGISYFLLDMKAPGVEVRPIKQANGEYEFAELFLTDVRVHVSDLIGEENQGWMIAQSTLAAERGVLSFEGGERYRYELESYFANAVKTGAAWLQDVEMVREFTRLFGEMQACRRLLRRLLRENEVESPNAAVTVVHVKVVFSQLRRKVGDFLTRVGDFEGQRFFMGEGLSNPVMAYIDSYALTIAGGSNEIMRNIFAERVLGMPKG